MTGQSAGPDDSDSLVESHGEGVKDSVEAGIFHLEDV